MNLDAQDIITALQNQRNGALNEASQLYAMVEALKRELQELKDKQKEPAKPAA